MHATFENQGFRLTHQGGNVYAYQMQIGDRFILITPDDESLNWIVGLHSAVDCITYVEIEDIGADTVQTAIDFAKRLAIACFVRALTRSLSL